MTWKDIEVSSDGTNFLFEGRSIFKKQFLEVLKFHSPGLAPVIDKTGAYHIEIHGEAIYSERYNRTFGFYCNRAAVVLNEKWFHIDALGNQVYSNSFRWTGNYQENLCTVRDTENQYYHIDLNGQNVYSEKYNYAGDFKDGIACVKKVDGSYKHIDTQGNYINNMDFLDLGIVHKNYATAKDEKGWHHIDKQGRELYSQRYLAIEPFYNGFALVTQFNMEKVIIDEKGSKIITI